MALVRFGAIVSSIRGRIGHTVFQETAAGPILRYSQPHPNRNTIRQNTVRAITARLQAEWIELTEDDRDTWAAFVRYNPIHMQRNTGLFINGQQAFLKANHNRLQYGLTVLKTPQFNKCDHTPIDVELRQAGPNLFIDFDRNPIPSEEFIILKVSIPLPITWNNSRGTEKILVFTTTVAVTKNITTEYFDLYKKATASGDTLFFKFTNADKRSGLFFPFKSKKVTL